MRRRIDCSELENRKRGPDVPEILPRGAPAKVHYLYDIREVGATEPRQEQNGD